MREELKTFEIFELGTIDEARGLAVQLRESAGPGPSSDAAKQAIELRDGVFVLLRRRIGMPAGGGFCVLGQNFGLLQEARRLRDRWNCGSGTIVLPGLELTAGGRGTAALLFATTGAELRSLQAAARAADTECQFTLPWPWDCRESNRCAEQKRAEHPLPWQACRGPVPTARTREPSPRET